MTNVSVSKYIINGFEIRCEPMSHTWRFKIHNMTIFVPFLKKEFANLAKIDLKQLYRYWDWRCINYWSQAGRCFSCKRYGTPAFPCIFRPCPRMFPELEWKECWEGRTSNCAGNTRRKRITEKVIFEKFHVRSARSAAASQQNNTKKVTKPTIENKKYSAASRDYKQEVRITKLSSHGSHVRICHMSWW